jgi:DNA-binding MarR family transcriptional regulator
MPRTLDRIAALPPHQRAEARCKAEHTTLRPHGTAHRIMRILLLAPEQEFSLRELVLRSYLHRNAVNPACARLELLGFVAIRRDHAVPRLPGGSAPRWVRLTEAGRAVAACEGISAAPTPAPAVPTARVERRT